MGGDTLVFIVVLGVLAYIARRLLERTFGPFPEEPDRGVEAPWRDPPWWWLPDEEESRWPWDPSTATPSTPSMTTGGGEGGPRLAADLEQDFARPLAWGASPPSCSRSAQPAWGASRGALFHPEGRRERGREGKRGELLRPPQGELLRLEGKRKRKKTSRPLPSFFKEKEKPSASRFAVLKERGGGRGKGPLGLEEIASSWMRE